MTRLTRRQFLGAGGAAAAAAALGVDAVFEARTLTISRHDLASPTLPPALDGFRIAHVSDLHLPSVASDKAADALATEAPDVIVITGDTISYRSRFVLVTPLISRMRARLGIFATRGNNEHWSRVPVSQLAAAYAAAGATLLENSHIVVGDGDARLQIVGLDDPAVGHPDVDAAFHGTDPSLPTILAMHAPGYIDKIDPRAHRLPPALLVLAGHTHGGQIRAPGCTPYVPRGSGRFRQGFYDSALGRVYITRGIGTSVISARLFCPPELPIFTLRRRA